MTKDFSGVLFLIVGNSGAGKDAIISGLINKYPSNLKKIYAPQRYITRAPSETEKNISISPLEFREMKEDGKFAFKWHIYNLDYGVHIEIEDWLRNGHPVIINVSRTIVNEAKEKYKNIKVIFIDVPFELTYKRIKDRKRESKELLNERIERAKNNQKFPEADFIVDNSGKLDDAINQLLEYIIKIIKKSQ